MAKVKKTDTLTLEKQLKQALVPEGEQPYPIPDNWCWTYLIKGFAECLDNFRKPINTTERTEREGEIPYYGATGQVGWINDYLTDEQLVLVGEDGAPFLDFMKDKAYLIEGKAWVNNHAHILRSYYEHIGNRFLVNYLNSFNYKNYVNGTTRLKLTQGSLNTIPIVLPPLAEQKRIVDRIESLFAKLDEAKEKVQTALDSFETRKAAILHKAFTGELTAKWREENDVGIDSWKKKKINEISTTKAGYAFDSKLFSSHGFQIVRMGNLFGGMLDLSRNPVFINEDSIDSSIIDKFMIYQGDILLTLTGTKYKRDYGYAVKIEDNNKCLLNQRILSLTPNNGVVPNFILYYLRSDIFRNVFFSNETGGVNQGNVSSKFVESIEVMLPLLLEQAEIVRLLDNFFAKEQRAKELCSVLDKIDLIKKSILARAFRGKLGTNDPNDENAVELLKQCFQQDKA